MTTPGARQRTKTEAPPGRCFLCAFADHDCSVPALDGTLRGVAERWRGGRNPALLLATAKDRPTAIVLDERARTLARALAALPAEQLRALHLRAYHLHRGPQLAAPEGQPGGEGTGAGYPTLRSSPASVLVLEPDLLLNITDINNADYCVRQYVLRRLVPSPPTAATLRGTILHGAFKELLKGRGDEPQALLSQAMRAYATDLAIHQFSMDALAADAEPHLAALTAWYARQRQQLWSSTPNIRAETFMLAPQVGLKGRLDALWEDDHTSQLLELKTSTVYGELPRRAHRWQVHGYQTLLAARRPREHNGQPAATLLYSGTPGQAEAHTLKLTLHELQRVIELRNLLAIVHVTGAVPPPPGERKCGRCALRAECLRAAPLLGWEPPPSDEHPEPVDPRDAVWFRRYHDLLRLEGRGAEEAVRMLWTTTPAERVAAGVALDGLEQVGAAQVTKSGEWEYTFRCANVSELREGDLVLVSDGDPIHGAAVTGTILRVSSGEVVVWTPEPITRPALIDRYGSEIVHDRTVRNLWRWLGVDPRLRALVRGERRPEFATPEATHDIPELNPEQRAAVARALAARDFLLIQGPPGTGKTRVVAEIVRRLVQRGERVLVAAFTNQAVDNVLARLVQDGFTGFVRLGHELSVAPELQAYRLGPRAAALAGLASPGSPEAVPDPAAVRAAFAGAQVVAATTATWSSERFDDGGAALAFDVAVVDEASQLTVPALLGALRFAQRFILVGDERQLPPLVVSPEAAAGGLGESLFAALLERWGPVAGAALTRQYRMHPTICEFPSQEFYDEELKTDGPALTARLALAPGPQDRLDAVLDPERPVVFVDVPAAEEREVEQGRASQAQARAVRRLVQGLRARGVPAERIGGIAPYRAQVAAIRQCLAARGEASVVVDTVDRFQGGEREVILVSFGLERADRSSAARPSFVADPHRLNVALTRAQRKLILLGDRGQLEAEPRLRRLIASCQALYGGQGGLVRAQIEREASASRERAEGGWETQAL